MTDVRRGVTARELIRAIHDDGFVLRRTRGSHRIYRDARGRRVVLAFHRMSDTFPLGTLQAIIRDTGWSEADLRRLHLLPA